MCRCRHVLVWHDLSKVMMGFTSHAVSLAFSGSSAGSSWPPSCRRQSCNGDVTADRSGSWAEGATHFGKDTAGEACLAPASACIRSGAACRFNLLPSVYTHSGDDMRLQACYERRWTCAVTGRLSYLQCMSLLGTPACDQQVLTLHNLNLRARACRQLACLPSGGRKPAPHSQAHSCKP